MNLQKSSWAGYTQKGVKTMFGKKYPNCVKKQNNMAYLNANIPTITCFIRNEFLFNHDKGHNEFTAADVHSVATNRKRERLCLRHS